MNQFKFQFSQAYDGYLFKDHTQLHYSHPSAYHKHYLLIVLLIDLLTADDVGAVVKTTAVRF